MRRLKSWRTIPAGGEGEEEEGGDEEEGEPEEGTSVDAPAREARPAALRPPKGRKKKAAPYHGTTYFTLEERNYWESYLLTEKMLNPKFKGRQINKEMHEEFRKSGKDPDDRVFKTKLKSVTDNFLYSTRKYPKSARQIAEAVGAYNKIAVANNAPPYDPSNADMNNKEWCVLAANTISQLESDRCGKIERGEVPPTDYDAREQADMNERLQAEDRRSGTETAQAQRPTRHGQPATPVIQQRQQEHDSRKRQAPASSPRVTPSDNTLANRRQMDPETRGTYRSSGADVDSSESDDNSAPDPFDFDFDSQQDTMDSERVQRGLFLGPNSVASLSENLLNVRLNTQDEAIQKSPVIKRFKELSRYQEHPRPTELLVPLLHSSDSEGGDDDINELLASLLATEKQLLRSQSPPGKASSGQSGRPGGFHPPDGGASPQSSGGGGGGSPLGRDSPGGPASSPGWPYGGGGGGDGGGGDYEEEDRINENRRAAAVYLTMHDTIYKEYPDVVRLIRWPSRILEFNAWVKRRWPEMYLFIRWPRLMPPSYSDMNLYDLLY
ncbi:hypothetical protein R1flu_016512 [Riccia fluitans]|uniref:Uncharacterized protein n=1 Tax=Riccia fluitans TaxID=41844 RepID=A0ABD1YM26_9MARC